MKRLVNKVAIEKTNYDSSYVGVLSYHAFQLKEEGIYVGHILHKDTLVDQIKINVSKASKHTQVNIDFNHFDSSGVRERSTQNFELGLNGCVILLHSTKNHPFRLKLEKPGKVPGRGIVYDTKKLDNGAIYSCVLLRPGTYEVCFKRKAVGTIKVEYPTASTDRARLNEALRVQVDSKGIKPSAIKALPMQGDAFEFETAGSIQVNLLKEEKSRNLLYKEARKLKKQKKKAPINKKYSWKNPAHH